MFAARDQENLVHGRQVAASSKPMNQGVAPKTPAPMPFKTPFRVALRDENALVGGGGGKTVVKIGHENLRTAGKKLDKTAFMTPGPRDHRAPLGAKTTNAKAKPFQTPGPVEVPPLIGALKDASAKEGNVGAEKTTVRKAKAKITLRAEPAVVEPLEDEDGKREIEYMPPRAKDLPDHPTDIVPANVNYAALRGANLTRGWFGTYCNPVGAHGVTQVERQLQDNQKEADREFDEQMIKAVEEMPLLGWNVPEFDGDEPVLETRKRLERERQQQQKKTHDEAGDATTVKGKGKDGRGPLGTMTAKTAVSLLARPPSHVASVRGASAKSSAGLPPLSSKTKKPDSSSRAAPSSLLPRPGAAGQTTKRSAATMLPPPGAAAISTLSCASTNNYPNDKDHDSAARHANAAIASRSTVGYSRGRLVSGSLLQQQQQQQQPSTITSATAAAAAATATKGRNSNAASSTMRKVPRPTAPSRAAVLDTVHANPSRGRGEAVDDGLDYDEEVRVLNAQLTGAGAGAGSEFNSLESLWRRDAEEEFELRWE
ncbi:MAG: hypothetical protein M1826_001013 [Phylliscum demangeonii]|nr:MAG: hypothetical protein M1826_001013 [Phylliscum demangeonii]